MIAVRTYSRQVRRAALALFSLVLAFSIATSDTSLAQVKIGALPTIANPPSTIAIPGSTGGTTYQVTPSQIFAAGSAFNYIATSGSLTIGQVAAVNTTASRTLTLPPLSGLTQGQWVATLDLNGLAATYNYTVTANGSDPINGTTPNVVTVAGSQVVRYVVGPGAASWYVQF
jgi:hypothetical protein